MAKSKENNWLSSLLYLLIIVLLFGLLRRTWKPFLVCGIIAAVLVFTVPDYILFEFLYSFDPLVLEDISPDNMGSIRLEQVGMLTGMMYTLYLIYLVVTGKFISTLVGESKFGKEMKKIEKMTNDDPDLQSQLESVAYHNRELQKKLKIFCKKNPNHILCDKNKLKEKGKVKTYWK